MRNTTQTKNKEKPLRLTSLKASTKSTPYPSSGTSNKSPRDTAEELSAPTAISWDIGRKTADSTNAPTAISTNPITKSICAFSDPLDLTANPKPPSNKNHRHHHPSPFKSPIREASRIENPPPPSLCQPPPHHLLTEESKRTKERGRKRTTTPANKGRLRERSTELSMR